MGILKLQKPMVKEKTVQILWKVFLFYQMLSCLSTYCITLDVLRLDIFRKWGFKKLVSHKKLI
jgi:hypothetical protein